MRVPVMLLVVAVSAGTLLERSQAKSAPAEPQTSCVVRRYSLVAVPLQPAAINEEGEIAGTTKEHRAATCSAREGLREIPLPDGYAHSEGLSLDDRGRVVGIAYNPGYTVRRGFLFAGGSFIWLEGQQSHGYRINDSGTVAGESIPPGARCSGPALWVESQVRALGECRGSARSVNTAGQVIGDAYDDQGRYHAFLWDARDGMRQIGPSAPFSSAIAINERGHVLIQAYPSVFLYADGASTRLDLSSRYPSQPHAINDCDVVVGSFGPFSDANRAFVWQRKSGFQDLNLLLTGGTPEWKLESAAGINNRGDIVGKGDHGRVDDLGFMLIPVD